MRQPPARGSRGATGAGGARARREGRRLARAERARRALVAKPGQGNSLPLTGDDEYEAETFFPTLGMAIRVVSPGETTGTHHWETEQEDFLVLHREGLLIVEGPERPVKQWDFVHCPPETKHAFVGARNGRA